jgi:16S rRNA (cytosine1402-N4)-methyltransferase
MNKNVKHQAVLLEEVINALNIKPTGIYVDATFGYGGHTRAILDSLDCEGRLLAIDRDPDVEHYARCQFKTDPRFIFARNTFNCLKHVSTQYGFMKHIAGILMDVGVSSGQLDNAERGFSFKQDGPLDMRMDPTSGMSAADWLASVSERTLFRVLKEFGEERFARRIARAIVAAQRIAPITTTGRLAQIIADAVPTREPHKHPATRSFQALRIKLNSELTQLQDALEQALDVLAPHGRLVVISFHSLEDRLVKRFMREQVQGGVWPPNLPIPADRCNPTLRIIGRPLRPTAAEIQTNPRARSAIMRVAERLP